MHMNKENINNTISETLTKYSMIGIIGQTMSGKSTLLSTIINKTLGKALLITTEHLNNFKGESSLMETIIIQDVTYENVIKVIKSKIDKNTKYLFLDIPRPNYADYLEAKEYFEYLRTLSIEKNITVVTTSNTALSTDIISLHGVNMRLVQVSDLIIGISKSNFKHRAKNIFIRLFYFLKSLFVKVKSKDNDGYYSIKVLKNRIGNNFGKVIKFDYDNSTLQEIIDE